LIQSPIFWYLVLKNWSDPINRPLPYQIGLDSVLVSNIRNPPLETSHFPIKNHQWVPKGGRWHLKNDEFFKTSPLNNGGFGYIWYPLISLHWQHSYMALIHGAWVINVPNSDLV
jgi:hypothetical protein